ncbi:hypothetical protein GGR56DRAFT_683112 [Xylariaceae sp. FL0804]|nr:hypothetical protein GGR56DRAFT_683112 [Xylariaceae sp. FL0804]
MSSKAPSEGTKVTLGKDAPVKSEGPGAVPSDSLAAESKTFREANQVDPSSQQQQQQQTSSSQQQSSSKSSGGSGSGGGGGGAKPSSVAGTAPSYVQNLYHRDPAGPHGKNIKEDPNLSGGKNASFTEFGTEADPARAAEQRMLRGDAAAAGQSAGRERDVDNKQPYAALGAEEEA